MAKQKKQCVPLETIRKMYTALFDTDLDTKDFAEDFFYIIGNILNGKTLEEIFGSSEMSPRGPAAGTLRMILENKNRIPDESKKNK